MGMAREDVLLELDKFSRQKRPVPLARDQDSPAVRKPDRPWSRSDKILAVVAGATVATVAVSLAALAAGGSVAALNARRARARRR
jgi:hypothetical protein